MIRRRVRPSAALLSLLPLIAAAIMLRTRVVGGEVEPIDLPVVLGESLAGTLTGLGPRPIVPPTSTPTASDRSTAFIVTFVGIPRTIAGTTMIPLARSGPPVPAPVPEGVCSPRNSSAVLVMVMTTTFPVTFAPRAIFPSWKLA